MTRFGAGDVGRVLLVHVAAATAAGFGFMAARVVLAAGGAPELGVWALLWWLAGVQCAIVGAAAAIMAVALATLFNRGEAWIFRGCGLAVGAAVAVLGEQANATFLVPALTAGLIYGDGLHRFAWRAMAASG